MLLLVLLCLTIGKTRSASKKGGPKVYRIWETLVKSPVSIGAQCRSGYGPPVDNAISLGQSICTGKLWQLLKMKIQEALIVARPSAIWREAL